MSDERDRLLVKILESDSDDDLSLRLALCRLLNRQDGSHSSRILPDGRMLRVVVQLFNFKLTLSANEQDPGWSESW